MRTEEPAKDGTDTHEGEEGTAPPLLEEPESILRLEILDDDNLFRILTFLDASSIDNFALAVDSNISQYSDLGTSIERMYQSDRLWKALEERIPTNSRLVKEYLETYECVSRYDHQCEFVTKVHTSIHEHFSLGKQPERKKCGRPSEVTRVGYGHFNC